MQNHYNLVYREEEREMIPLCVDQGIGLIPWSPLARGVLTRPRPADADVRSGGTTRSESDDYSPKLYDQASGWAVVDAVQHVAQRRDLPMAQIALAWLLSRPGVVAPIIGATKLSHLNDALAALDVALSADESALLEAPYRPHGVKGHQI
jgi:aryl-alcohol dehydrogenase-like predicted oxidoreductase